MSAVKPHIRILTAAASALMMGMTITACAEKETSTTISAREGRDRAVELVLNTTEQLDITGWWPRNGVAAADECIPKSRSGIEHATASYSYDRWAPRGTDHIEDAKRVADYWESLGMTVRTVNPTTHPTVFAEGGPIARAVFDTAAADQSYSVGATAPCSPGDAVTLNDEDEAERDQGKVLPGDEGLVLQDPPQ